jgi:AraC-like DNA-binding protein
MTRSTQPRAHDTIARTGGIVRLATLLPVPVILRERGVDAAAVLTRVGLDLAQFDDAENQMPFRTAGLLLQRCAEASGCGHFGLLVGQRSSVAALGRLGNLMRQSPTVYAALRSLILHLHLQNRGGVPTHTIAGDSASVGYAIYQPDMPGTAQVHDLVAAMSYNILRSLCGAKWSARAVTFSHAAPADARPYRRFFQAPLQFDAGATAIVFAKKWLDHALPGTDATLHRLLQRSLAEESTRLSDLVERVRVALRTMIPTGRATETSIAQILEIPSRTLRRQLMAHGTNFRRLAKETRYEIARQLLTDTGMAIAEIAAVLEYADASAFTRAFRTWTNSSPAAWRAMQSA